MMDEQLGDQIGNVMRMLRMIEQRYRTLRERLRLSDSQFISVQKDLGENIRSLTREVTDVQSKMQKLEYKLGLLNKQLNESASKDDVNTLQRYVEMWQPQLFVTKKEAEKMIKPLKKGITP